MLVALALWLSASAPAADVGASDVDITNDYGDGIWAWIDQLEGMPAESELTQRDLDRIKEHDQHTRESRPRTTGEPTGPDRTEDIQRPQVARFITYFTTTAQGRQTYAEWLARAARYRPIVDAELEKRGLPRELFYVAMAESGFDPRSYSPTHAAGLWQFIPRTGTRYGLRVDRWVDERRDPEKATGAALSYLTDLNKQFDGDWLLAYAGYNWGEHRVEALMEKSGKKDFWGLLKTRRVPQETSHYVPLIVACAHIGEDLEGYGFTADGDDVLEYDTIHVDRAVALDELAKRTHTSKKKLAELNLPLRRGATPPEGYALRIPKGKGEAYVAAAKEAPTWTPPKATKKRVLRYARHKVKRGEALSKIAKRYGVSTRTLVRVNNLKSANKIYAGMTLKIPKYVWITVHEDPPPTKAVASSSKPAPTKAATSSTPQTKPETKPDPKPAPKQAAAKPPAPVKKPAPKPAYRTVRYTIKSGDTLSQIAQRYGISTRELQRQNNISNASRIYAGQVLKIRYRT